MKKLLLGMGVVALLSTNIANAQNEQGQLVISAGAGQSLMDNFVSGLENIGEIPVINGMVDFAVSDLISLGLGISYQSVWGEDSNSYTLNNATYYENVTQTWTKLNVGVRMNFHYARSISDKLDLYSGFRVGYSNWTKDNDSSDPDYVSLIDEIKLPFAFQIVPIGARYYFTDMIGIHFETGVIGPYYAAGGVSFKL